MFNGKYGTEWFQRVEPTKILAACETFLELYEGVSPPSYLRSFVSAVIMLQCHIKWVQDFLNRDLLTALPQYDHQDCRYLLTFCGVLRIFESVMGEVVSDKDKVITKLSSVQHGFDLSSQDIYFLNKYNSYWGDDEFLPMFDLNLLEIIEEDISSECVEEITSHPLEVNGISHPSVQDKLYVTSSPLSVSDKYDDGYFKELLWSDESTASLSMYDDDILSDFSCSNSGASSTSHKSYATQRSTRTYPISNNLRLSTNYRRRNSIEKGPYVKGEKNLCQIFHV